ncbi:DegT/DnrJ/EryC1/StrS family aminotransferase [Sphingobium nicotianae]|uniref:DegT/DnrJ/EryC1/StrS family aminotransferase n=1 Tax=Sphingobium nicotianae TaxID=2782607 RepID=A0A9X1IS61_9SPHN|nr:DegT/DnrJ/EryC1/StrS family aminotransferase [Sphingobium nicotianae]MBT2188113.1 DegT/DnrJ/EryC1/StrS family aminotransferase [Sphingobium nicotianae]
MSQSAQPKFAIQSVVPDLPEPADYLPWLERMHQSGYYSNFGPLCREFSHRMLGEFGSDAEECVPCGSATAGLSAALVACKVERPVLIPAFTFPATLSAVRAAGLEAIVMDVASDDWVPHPDQVDEALTMSGAGAIILVAPFGIRFDFSVHIDVCRRHGAIIIIDCAAGMGVPRVNFCEAADLFEVFSLHATKPFGVGEGGLVFCHSSRRDAVQSALNFALSSYQSEAGPHWGFNGKISEMHIAVALAQLERYRGVIARRQLFAKACFAMLTQFSTLVTPAQDSIAPWQIFPVAMPSERAADLFVENAGSEGMEIRRYYRPSLSRWPRVRLVGACPISEDLAARMVALPVRGSATAVEAQPILDRLSSSLRYTLNRIE